MEICRGGESGLRNTDLPGVKARAERKAGQFLALLARGKENQYTKVQLDSVSNSKSEYKEVLTDNNVSYKQQITLNSKLQQPNISSWSAATRFASGDSRQGSTSSFPCAFACLAPACRFAPATGVILGASHSRPLAGSSLKA